MLQSNILFKYECTPLFAWTTRSIYPVSCYSTEAYASDADGVVMCMLMKSTAVFHGISSDTGSDSDTMLI